MKAKTEAFLYSISWAFYVLSKPTWRSMTDSYEQWVYREGLQRQLERLERAELVEFENNGANSTIDSRLLRLTEKGRIHVLGGRDPEAWWNRAWDGRWRVVMFDVPISKRALRDKFRRQLSSFAFGCLQQSGWVTPDPLEEQKRILHGTDADTSSLLTLEARPATGETDEEIVLHAWDFVEINRRYSKVLEALEDRPQQKLETESSAARFRQWAAREREAWLAAMAKDPLLPLALLPTGYLGRKAWQTRCKVLKMAHEQIAAFDLKSGK
jgi:phenylacetic acid degradation operon negative regulatory protein